MAAEIAEQPDVLARLIERRQAVHAAVQDVVPSPLQGVALVGRGSSGNALLFARYALEIAGRRPATFVAPSAHDLYAAEVDYRGYLAIVASQSGRTPEIVEAATRLRRAGAATVALTANVAGDLAQAAQVVFDLCTGHERAVPATKTFTAQVALSAFVAEAIGPTPWRHDDWTDLPERAREVTADPGASRRIAQRLGAVQRLAVVGRGFGLALAHETALKLQETALLAAVPHSYASFRHGPIAAAGPDFPVLVFAADASSAADTTRLVEDLRGRDVPTVTVGPGPGCDLPTPVGPPEALQVILGAIRLQQLSVALAVARGLDPDSPPLLAKVTLT
jgi:glucosamine--fructose-6-phosphate aminotransferase (isomerizing)